MVFYEQDFRIELLKPHLQVWSDAGDPTVGLVTPATIGTEAGNHSNHEEAGPTKNQNQPQLCR